MDREKGMRREVGNDKLCYFFAYYSILVFSFAVPIILSTLTYYSQLCHMVVMAHIDFITYLSVL